MAFRWMAVNYGIITAICGLASVASAESYPIAWAPPVIESGLDCPDISGFYTFYGEYDMPTVGAAYTGVDKTIFNDDYGDLPIGVKIFYHRDNNILEYEFVGSNLSQDHRRLFKHELRCEGGWVTWDINYKGSSTDSPTVASRSKRKMTKAQDGALVVNYQNELENSFLIFFTYKKTKAGWIRFAPIDNRK